jgi:thiol:disulfide interchange protein DsbD
VRPLVVATLLAAVGVMGAVPPAVAATDLLPARDAFQVSAKLDPDGITVRYRVADGYYLYRDKIRFESDPAVPGKPRLPRGVTKHDEFFGKSEIYRGEVVIRIPTRSREGDQVTLTATSQGCADAGVCYPPSREVLTLTAGGGAVSPATVRPSPSGSSLIDALGGKP